MWWMFRGNVPLDLYPSGPSGAKLKQHREEKTIENRVFQRLVA
jgi:hypothetical protein